MVKMDGRLLMIFVFAIVEISAQNFYPNRYGKRDVQAIDEQWSSASQYDRRSDPSGNLFFGSRYGKRSYNATPPESLSENSAVGDRYGRSSDMTNSERFFFGSRFGKRSHPPSSSAEISSETEHLQRADSNQEFLVCRYTGFRHLYHCLAETSEEKVLGKVL